MNEGPTIERASEDAFPERLSPLPEPELRLWRPWGRFWLVPTLVCVTRGAAYATFPAVWLVGVPLLALPIGVLFGLGAAVNALRWRDGRIAAFEAALAAWYGAGTWVMSVIVAGSPLGADPC